MPTIITQPSVTIDTDLLAELETYVSDIGQVVVHGICRGGVEGTMIRIWPTTYLFDHHSDHTSELVYHEKISSFPQWTEIKPNKDFGFTLVFSGLPSSCVIFDLVEVIPQSNGFYIPAIVRNDRDVYYLDFS
jgi:hypothetical protein